MQLLLGHDGAARSAQRQKQTLSPIRDGRSSEQLSGDDATPHRYESRDHAEGDVERGHENFAVLKAAKRLVFKRGECRIASDESNGNEITPIGAPMRLLGQKCKHQANQERARDIDDESAVRETRSHAIADYSS